jgi:hypothetical protein
LNDIWQTVVAPKQKPNEPAVKPFNVMDWWRDVGSAEYPKLAKVALQFLSVPSSSACVERIFNAGFFADKLCRRNPYWSLPAFSRMKFIFFCQCS